MLYTMINGINFYTIEGTNTSRLKHTNRVLLTHSHCFTWNMWTMIRHVVLQVRIEYKQVNNWEMKSQLIWAWVKYYLCKLCCSLQLAGNDVSKVHYSVLVGKRHSSICYLLWKYLVACYIIPHLIICQSLISGTKA